MATPCCAAFARGWPSCRAGPTPACGAHHVAVDVQRVVVARRDQRRAEASGRIRLAWPHKAARDNDGRMDGSLQRACVRACGAVQAKQAGNYYVEAEPKLLFVIRIKGTQGVAPEV